MRIHLIQPRHIYAPPNEVKQEGHIYMPTSLLSVAGRLLKCGVDVTIEDENISMSTLEHEVIGLNLLGAPYIPVVQDYIKRLELINNKDCHLILGGQIMTGLSEDQISRLYNDRTYNGNENDVLQEVLQLTSFIPEVEHISLKSAYEILPSNYLKKYLSEEFCFYLSQGCKHSCSFCSADRTIIDPVTNKKKRVKERYRKLDIAINDLEYLIKKSVQFGIDTLNIYLSNLDLFQSPLLLNDFALGVKDLIKNYTGINLKIRGLSTCRSFLKTHKSSPNVIRRMKEIGLHQIGFGIDGATPKVYKETRKPQNVKESLDSITICKSEYNITPESLMVFGHNNSEDEESLKLAVIFCKEMQTNFGALPRPHVAKDIVPGNDGWRNSHNRNVIERLIANPKLFQNLDFTALPSTLTHPNKDFRILVNKYYKQVCELPNSLTQYVLPYELNMSKEEELEIYNHNLERYDI